MAKNNAASLLTSVDELFTTQEERDSAQRTQVIDLPTSVITDFPHHPYKIRMDTSMIELMDSVKKRGVHIPAIVRPMSDGTYQMVAGHRRKYATEQAERPTLPCVVCEMTDDEAIITMVDTNIQREEVLPSEKAFAYKMKLGAMKRQGQRTDLTLSPVATKLDTAAEIGKASKESRDQVFRYIRLTNLTPELLQLVDNTVLKEKGMLQMALRPAVELSYLREDEQKVLYETIISEDCTPSHAQAIKIRKFSESRKLNPQVLLSIMQEAKPNQVEQFKMPKERISKFFAPGTPVRKMEDTIVKALELYRRRQREIER